MAETHQNKKKGWAVRLATILISLALFFLLFQKLSPLGNDRKIEWCKVNVSTRPITETLTKRVKIRDAYIEYKSTPTEFEKVSSSFVIVDGGPHDSKWQTVEETVIVQPATVEYEVTLPVFMVETKFISLGQFNKQEQFQSFQFEKLVQNGQIKEKTIPAVTTKLVRRIITEYGTSNRWVPEAKKERWVQNLVKSPSTKKIINHPAQYKTVSKIIEIEPGELVSRDAVCNAKHVKGLIADIQKELASDLRWGKGLERKLETFQKSNGLPSGRYVTRETLESLGVDYSKYE